MLTPIQVSKRRRSEEPCSSRGSDSLVELLLPQRTEEKPELRAGLSFAASSFFGLRAP